MKALQTWLTLPIREKWLVIEAWIDLLWVAALLRTPFHHRLMRPSKSFSDRDTTFHQLFSTIRLVNSVASLHVKRMTCLERTLAAQRVLKRRGIDVVLRIGVNQTSGEVEAHAWLEYDGKPLDERAPQYSILRDPRA